MDGRRLSLALLALSASTCLSAAKAQDQQSYLLSAQGFACVRDNLQKYLATGSGVLIIAVDRCPTVSDNPLLDSLRAEVPDPSIDPDTVTDSLLAVTGDQLQCVAATPIPDDARMVRFYFQDCRLEFVK